MFRLKLRHRTSRCKGGQYVTATLGTQQKHEKCYTMRIVCMRKEMEKDPSVTAAFDFKHGSAIFRGMT